MLTHLSVSASILSFSFGSVTVPLVCPNFLLIGSTLPPLFIPLTFLSTLSPISPPAALPARPNAISATGLMGESAKKPTTPPANPPTALPTPLPIPDVSFLPVAAAAFIPSRVSVPYFSVASLVNTNSPGVSIAGTVSVLPFPGTDPPLFILTGSLASIFLSLSPPPFILLAINIPPPTTAAVPRTANPIGDAKNATNPGISPNNVGINPAIAATVPVIKDPIPVPNNKNPVNNSGQKF